MKKVLFVALSVLSLAACSKEEVIQQKHHDDISFIAVTNKAVSRSIDGYCNKSMPESFKVWANIKDGESAYKPYFAGDVYKKKDDSSIYENKDVVRYWPNVTVNFFACLNATPDWKADKSTIVVTDFTVDNDVTKQVDFIYATVKEASKPAPDAIDKAQKINFRHALSQIEFMAKNDNSKIYVEISSVKVKNVFNQGTFEFPKESTVINIPGTVDGSIHNPLPGDQTISNQGTWTINASSKDSYTASFPTVPVAYNENPSLTVTDPAGKEFNENTMYLMPYGVKNTTFMPTWDGTGKPTESADAYFQITAKIWNVAATTDITPGTVNKTTDIVLYDGEIAIKMPTKTVWEQGKRYVYTFTFTKKGNGGSNPDSGNEVLTPITLNVTVDDFVNGGNTGIDMNK